MKKRPIEILTAEEARQLIDSCSRRAPSGVRNAAMLAVLYRSGLRISEALSLRPKDIDIKAKTVRVLHGKGDKARTVAVDDIALRFLERWLDRRKQLGLNGRHPVFCTISKNSSGVEMSQAYVRSFLRRLKAKTGISKRIHAHGFRHTHAAELANEGVPVHVIQQQLGHSNVSVTSQYINHLSPQQVIRAIQSRPVPQEFDV